MWLGQIEQVKRYINTITKCIRKKNTALIDDWRIIRAIRDCSESEAEWLAPMVNYDKLLRLIKKLLKPEEKRVGSKICNVRFDCCHGLWRITYKNGTQSFYGPEWRTGVEESVDCEIESRMQNEMALLYD